MKYKCVVKAIGGHVVSGRPSNFLCCFGYSSVAPPVEPSTILKLINYISNDIMQMQKNNFENESLLVASQLHSCESASNTEISLSWELILFFNELDFQAIPKHKLMQCSRSQEEIHMKCHV